MAQFDYFKPASNAWDRMTALLFQPFSLIVWLKIGLLAWLAFLFEGGGGGLSIPDFNNLNGNQHHSGGGSSASLPSWLLHPTSGQLAIMVGVGLALIFLFIILCLLFLWIKSLAKFMFIDGVVRGPDIPFFERWRLFARQGNSLFLFQICWSLGVLALSALPLGIMILMIVRIILGLQNSMSREALIWHGIVAGAALLILLAIAICAAVLLKLIVDFGTVHMYKNGSSAWTAARKSLAIAKANPLAAFLYLLCLICIGVAVFFAVLAFELATCVLCCIGCIIMMLPYIWAVAMLPALAFRQLFTIEFIGQAGEEFNLDSLRNPLKSAGDSI